MSAGGPHEKLPSAPPAELLREEVVPDVVELEADTRVARIYLRRGRHPQAWHEFRRWGPAPNSRFDHHPPPSGAGEGREGVLYGATGDDALATCVAERFQETRTVDRNEDLPWLVVFELAETVRLLSLRGKWPTRAGASSGINSNGRRDVTQGWTRSVYAAYPDLCGIYYSSSMNGGQPAVVLTERAAGAVPARPLSNRALSDASLTVPLRAICSRSTGIGYALIPA